MAAPGSGGKKTLKRTIHHPVRQKRKLTESTKENPAHPAIKNFQFDPSLHIRYP
jgi:hypothetical protein